MTQDTEQERTEFEAAYVAEKLRILDSEGSEDGEKAIRAVMLRRNANGDYDNSLEAHFAWWAWQVAHRAPVVQQGWKLVPVEPTPEMCERGSDEVVAPISTACGKANAVYRAMLAAAHQPPDAGCSVSNAETVEASMQLPDPELFAINTAPYGSETKRYEEVAKEFRNDHDVVCFYTGQQVCQLLANHAEAKR